MLTGIPIITKIKPNQLAPLSSGDKKLATDQKGGIFLTNLKTNLKALSTALAAEETEAVGTSISAILVLGATTLSDANPSDVCLLLSENKAGLFKSTLKAIDKFVKKGTKEIATCKFIYEGKKEGNKFVLGIEVLPACKMKMIPLIKWLDKLGKLTDLKFEVATNTAKEEEEVVEEKTPLPSNPKLSVLDQLVGRLETAENNYSTSSNSENLLAWGKILAKFKQVLAKNPDDSNLKSTFKEWLAKYNAAKKQSETTAPETPSTSKSAPKSLQERLIALENEIKEKKDPSLSEMLRFMSVCQEIRVNPSFKVVLKEDSDSMSHFKLIRKKLNSMIKADKGQLAEIEALLEAPTTITNKFQIELDELWSDFTDNTQTAQSFDDILNNNTVSMKENIKLFQQKVEAQAKGMLEASKMLKVGDPVEISKQMTTIRSSIVKLKETMATRISEVDRIAQELATLEANFLATEDTEVRQEIFAKVEHLTNNLAQHSEPVSVF